MTMRMTTDDLTQRITPTKQVFILTLFALWYPSFASTISLALQLRHWNNAREE